MLDVGANYGQFAAYAAKIIGSKGKVYCFEPLAYPLMVLKHMVYLRNLKQSEIEAFLTDLAVNGKISALTQNQAYKALLFLYRDVLDKEVFDGVSAVRAKKPQRLPTVLSVDETLSIIEAMTGPYQLMAKILYGCGGSSACGFASRMSISS